LIFPVHVLPRFIFSFNVRDPSGATAANARLESARAELDAAETRWLELSEFA